MKTLIATVAVASVMWAYTGETKADKTYTKLGAADLTGQAQVILWDKVAEYQIKGKDNVRNLVCLAENIYFEARAEPIGGKAAVANVTRNRVEDPRWPNTYCKVVQDGPVRESWKTKATPAKDDAVFYPIKHRCQFSWYCDGKADKIWANLEKTGETIKGNAIAWRDSLMIASLTLGYGDHLALRDNTEGAVFYYNHNLVNPSWSGKKTYIKVVGNHTFMK